VATERDDHKFLLGVVFPIYVTRESLAPSETVRALSHGGTRRIEAGKRQRVELADQVCGRARGQLLPQLIVTESGRITAAAFKTIRPVVIRGAIAGVSKSTKFFVVAVGAFGIRVRIAGRVGDDVCYVGTPMFSCI